MSTTVTMQLNADTVAGDWVTRPAGRARTATGSVQSAAAAEVLVVLSDLRGAVESIRRGAYSPLMSESRTGVADVSYGSPIHYHAMWFVTR